MSAVRTPKSEKAAAALCERFAELEGAIGEIEERRHAEISAINAIADEHCAPLLKQRAKILRKLESWWQDGGAAMLTADAKSVELGGCMIGTRSSPDSLGHKRPAAEMVAALRARRWAAELVRTSHSLNKRELLAALNTGRGDELEEIGFFRAAGVEQFFVKRTEQGGTQASAR